VVAPVVLGVEMRADTNGLSLINGADIVANGGDVSNVGTIDATEGQFDGLSMNGNILANGNHIMNVGTMGVNEGQFSGISMGGNALVNVSAHEGTGMNRDPTTDSVAGYLVFPVSGTKYQVPYYFP
jgi:hypothetical protein